MGSARCRIVCRVVFLSVTGSGVTGRGGKGICCGVWRICRRWPGAVRCGLGNRSFCNRRSEGMSFRR